MEEPEKITIVEGPTPDFRPNTQAWSHGIYQGYNEGQVVWCELRTINGEGIRDRCVDAWQEGRKVQLDYPDDMRLRQSLDVVAMRLKEHDEGTVLQLWLYQTVSEEEGVFDEERGLDDDEDDFA